jgi:hypothetical protein
MMLYFVDNFSMDCCSAMDAVSLRVSTKQIKAFLILHVNTSILPPSFISPSRKMAGQYLH